MARKRRTRAERAKRRREREKLDVERDSDRLPSVGQGRFFEDRKKYKTDLCFLLRWGGNAKWTDEQMHLAHDNVAKLAASDHADVALRAYDLIRKTVIETSKAQLELERFELAKSQQQSISHNHQHVHIESQSKSGSDANIDACSPDRVRQIAEKLGINLIISDEPTNS